MYLINSKKAILLAFASVLTLNAGAASAKIKRITPTFKRDNGSAQCAQVNTIPDEINYIGRVNTQKEMIDSSCVIDHQFVPIGVKRGYSISKKGVYPDEYFRFELKGAQDNTLDSGDRGRAELSNCYADQKNVMDNFKDKREFLFRKEIKDVYRYCDQKQKPGEEAVYRFSIRLPDNFADLNAIVAQWHGTNDRLLYKDTNGHIQKLNTRTISAYKTVLNHGGKFEQGGYPPLSLKVSDGRIYLMARNDPDVYTEKTDRCNIAGTDIPNMMTETERHCLEEDKSITIIYSQAIQPAHGTAPDALKAGEWIDFFVDVKFSEYKNYQKNMNIVDITPGHVNLWIKRNGVYQGNAIHWEGSLGRNDDTGTYFKFGIYRLGGNIEPTEIHVKRVSKN